MKLSAAAVTVAAISLLSTTHAAPLAFKDGEITGRLHHRRGSDISEISQSSSVSRADKALEELNIGFEPGSHLILPRILNFIKRQVSTGAAIASSAPDYAWPNQAAGDSTGRSDQDLHTSIMSPNLEEYGFASELGSDSALTPVRE